MKKPILAVSVTAALVVAAWVLSGYDLAAQSRSPEAQLKAAQHKEQVEGDLKGAIEQYKQLVARKDIPRAIAAEALMGLAQSYEKLGTADARNVYDRVVREYADQATIASLARDRSVLLTASGSTNLTARRLLRLPDAIAVLSLLSDGRIGGTDWNSGDLVLVDAKGATASVVRGDIQKNPGAWGEDPLLSPDKRQLAYQWFGPEPGRVGVIRVVSLDRDAKPRTIEVGNAATVTNIIPVGWSQDMQSVLVSYEKPMPAGGDRGVGRGDFVLAWVSVNGGAIRPLRTFEWWRNGPGSGSTNSIGTISLSPDGAWIAYAVTDRQGTPDTSIYLMRSDGSDERRVASGGNNQQPVWTADGAHLCFISNRSGDPALWVMPVTAGRAGTPTLVKTGMSRVDLLGVTASGSLIYSQNGVDDPLIVAELGSRSSGSGAPPTTIETLNGLVPSWSRDASALAYKRLTGNPARPVELVVRDSDTGELRTYRPRTGGMGRGRPTWHADGTVQAVTRSGIRVKPGVNLDEQATPALPMGFVSPDGRTVYAAAGDGAVEMFDTASGTQTGTIELPAKWRFASLAPDGRALALVSTDDTDWSAKVAVIGVDGKGFRQIGARLQSLRSSVAWTRDSSALIIGVSTSTNIFAIQRLPVAGGPAVTLASNIAGLRTFDISPDERLIAYSTDPGTTDVWTLDLKGVLKQ